MYTEIENIVQHYVFQVFSSSKTDVSAVSVCCAMADCNWKKISSLYVESFRFSWDAARCDDV